MCAKMTIMKKTAKVTITVLLSLILIVSIAVYIFRQRSRNECSATPDSFSSNISADAMCSHPCIADSNYYKQNKNFCDTI